MKNCESVINNYDVFKTVLQGEILQDMNDHPHPGKKLEIFE